jgi:nucleotide-binding universal stress UspA family protein
MFRKLLVAYDGSDGAERALRAGIELAKALSVDLHSIAVEEELPKYAATVDELEAVKEQKDAYFNQLNREAVSLAESEGVRLHPAVMPGHEVRAIIDHILKHGFDTLFLGFHGHSAISERIRGSTTGSLVLNAPCTVIVVK